MGSYLTQAIHDNLYCDVVATKMSKENLVLPGAEVMNLNILDKEQIKQVLNQERPDYIFHLAAQSSVALSWKNPGLTVDVNIKGALNLLDVIRELDYQPRVLIVGSGEEFGHIKDGMVPICEDAPLDPGNVYAVTKVTQNMMATIYANAYGLKLIMFAEKSWGSFQVIDVEDESMTIKVVLNPGHSMNYHSHMHRNEVWVVLSGEGTTIVDGMEQHVTTGDVITMQAGCRHTVQAITELKLIEVQLGKDISVQDKQKFSLE